MIFISYLVVVILLLFQVLLIKKYYTNTSSPSFYFTSIWALIFIFYILMWNQLPHLHFSSVLIFFLGATFFNFGSFFTSSLFNSRLYITNFENHTDKIILKYSVLFSALLLPVYFFHIINKYSVEDFFNNVLFGFNNIRRATVEDFSYGSNFDLINNLPIFINFIFLSSFVLLKFRKENSKILISSFLLNIIYNSLNGSKMSLITSFLVVFIILSYKQKRINLKYLISILIFLTFLFALLVYLINYTFIKFENSDDIFLEISNTVQIYFFGGPVAFDTYLNNNLYFGNNQAIYRPFIELLRSIGFNINIFSRNSDYITNGNISTNVYTIYYSLYDSLGIIFTFLFMFFYGILFETIYVLCKNGNRLFAIFYPIMIISIIFSIHAEQFISGISVLIKFAFFYVLLFRVLKSFLTPKNSIYRKSLIH